MNDDIVQSSGRPGAVSIFNAYRLTSYMEYKCRGKNSGKL